MSSEKCSYPSWINCKSMALCTDLYQLTMLMGYFKTGIHEKKAAFEYFFRVLPENTGFAIFAGLEQMLEGIEQMRFSDHDISYLMDTIDIGPDLLAYLKEFVPKVDIWAVPEGRAVFPNEPLIRVEGPVAAVQFIETFILNSINYPTLVATKAARVCIAAQGDPVLEFGLRRAQGPDGGLRGARAAYIGGCAATSNVLAGKEFGVPVSGTHAHSWIMGHPTELDAFWAYAKIFPDKCVLLVDTYDTLGSGVPNAIKVFKELKKKNPHVKAAIRLDSGDLAKLSKGAYKLLTEAGFDDPQIVASNDLDEYLIADLKKQGAKINAWGVGTQLITGQGHPALGGVYKLVAVSKEGGWEPKMKISSDPAKTTNPDRKNPVRLFNKDGVPFCDVIFQDGEPVFESGEIKAYNPADNDREIILRPDKVEQLFVKYMENGKIIRDIPSLDDTRDTALKEVNILSDKIKYLKMPEQYPVLLSEKIINIKKNIMEKGA